MQPKKISSEKFAEITDFFLNQTREIEKAQFHYIFLNGSAYQVCRVLKGYQNKDGGFGHAMEPDFRLPLSTPMATSIGLRILDSLAESPEKQAMITKTDSYLLESYNSSRNGWLAVPKEVNNYPHAPWWEYDPETKMSIIDKNWGNPTAEILAYLLKYKHFFSSKIHNIIPECLSKAISSIIEKEEFGSENEIFCYIHLYNNLDIINQDKLRPKISEAIKKLVIIDDSQWNNYVPQPVDFLSSPSSARFSFPEDHIEHNLDFLVEKLDTFGHFSPTWDFTYPQDMQSVPKEWTGELTLKYLKILKNYDRIDVNSKK